MDDAFEQLRTSQLLNVNLRDVADVVLSGELPES
jgi:hypothetical protein